MAKEITVTIKERGQPAQSFLVDGVLFVGTVIDEKRNVIVTAGKQFPLLTAQYAIEALCAGKGPDYIVQMKGQTGIICDALMEEAAGKVIEE